MDASWTLTLVDRSDTTLYELVVPGTSDLTKAIASNVKLSYRLNRPAMLSFDVPCDVPALNMIYADGDPVLWAGSRCVKAHRKASPTAAPQLLFNGIVMNLQPVADANVARATVTVLDPLIWAQYRIVRDATGNLITPTWNAGGPITAADWIQQAIVNSISNSGPAGDQEGAMGIDPYGGIVDLTGVDVASELMAYPMKIGDLISLMTEAGVVDVVIAPTDSSQGAAPGIIGVLNAVNQWGSDLPGVHFDYAIGDYSIRQLRYAVDFSTIATKLVHYVGPKRAKNRFAFNVDATTSGTTVDPAAARAKYGVWGDWPVVGDDTLSAGGQIQHRKLWIANWNTEARLRLKPRELLYLTPDAAAPFAPFLDYDLGDVIRVNTGPAFGREIAGAAQRIYGFDINVTDDGVEQVGELVTSADAE